jgi:hypothetical protein
MLIGLAIIRIGFDPGENMRSLGPEVISGFLVMVRLRGQTTRVEELSPLRTKPVRRNWLLSCLGDPSLFLRTRPILSPWILKVQE